jgi:4-hydroxy-tetrahydrodipicolinate synthase
MLTPWRDGAVDLEAARAFTGWLCASRASALFPVSGMGQYQVLTREEKAALIAAVVEAAQGEKPVFAGVGGGPLEDTLELARHAGAVGAAGVVVVTPDWLRADVGGIPDQDALVDYFRAVGQASALPLVIYDPRAEVTWDALARLAELPTLAGIKYRTRDALVFQRAAAAAGPDVAVMVGIEHVALPLLAAGGRGLVGGGANLFPDLLVELVEATRAGDLDRARALQGRVIEANDLLGQLGGRWAFRRLLREVAGVAFADEGRDEGPVPALDEGSRAELEGRLLRAAGLRR